MTNSQEKSATNNTEPTKFLVVIHEDDKTNNTSEAIVFRDCKMYAEVREFIDQYRKDVIRHGRSITVFEKKHKFVPGLVEEYPFIDDEDCDDDIDVDMCDDDEADTFPSDQSPFFTVRTALSPVHPTTTMHPGGPNPNHSPYCNNPQMSPSPFPGQQHIGFPPQIPRNLIYRPIAMTEPINIYFSDVVCRTRQSFYLLTKENDFVFMDANAMLRQPTSGVKDTSPAYVFIDAVDEELPHLNHSNIRQTVNGNVQGFLRVTFDAKSRVGKREGYPVVKTDDVQFFRP